VRKERKYPKYPVIRSPVKRSEFHCKAYPEICENTAEVGDFVINSQNHGVKNVFVSLRRKFEQLDFPQAHKPVILKNLKCRISNPLAGLRVNEMFSFQNSDRIFHSV
jgi:hypothetical protein